MNRFLFQDLPLLLFCIAGTWGLGLCAVAGLTRLFPSSADQARTFRLGRTEILGLGLILGLGINSWLLFLAGLIGIPLGTGLSVALAVGSLIGAGTLWRKGSFQHSSVPATKLVRACQGLLALLFANLLFQTLLTPQHLWDERAIFGIKAAVLFEDQSLRSPSLLSPEFVQYHPRYPLHIPLAEHNVCAVLGRFDDRLAKIVFPLMFLGVCLNFAGVLARHLTAGAAWLFALLLATVPCLTFWEYGFLCGQGDAPVACYHGLTMLYLWDWLLTARRCRFFDQAIPLPNSFSLSVAGLLAGLTIFVKDEGIAFLMVDASALGVLMLPGRIRQLPRRLLPVLVFGLSGAIIVVPWLWHRQSLPKTGEMTYFARLSWETIAAGMHRLNWSLSHLVLRMFREAKIWGLQWWGVIAALLLRPAGLKQRAQWLLLLDLIGALSALVLAALIAPTTVEEHLGGSSHRFLMQLVPVAVLLIAGQWLPEESPDASQGTLDSQAPGHSR